MYTVQVISKYGMAYYYKCEHRASAEYLLRILACVHGVQATIL